MTDEKHTFEPRISFSHACTKPVVVEKIKRRMPAPTELSELFAIYLRHYRDVSISIGSARIDPNFAIYGTWNFELTPIRDEQNTQHRVILEVIEWRRQTRRTLESLRLLDQQCAEPLHPVAAALRRCGKNQACSVPLSPGQAWSHRPLDPVRPRVSADHPDRCPRWSDKRAPRIRNS